VDDNLLQNVAQAPERYVLPEQHPNSEAPSFKAPIVENTDSQWEKLRYDLSPLENTIFQCENLWAEARSPRNDLSFSHLRNALRRSKIEISSLEDSAMKHYWIGRINYYLGKAG
jgi:hypothetical protein